MKKIQNAHSNCKSFSTRKQNVFFWLGKRVRVCRFWYRGLGLGTIYYWKRRVWFEFTKFRKSGKRTEVFWKTFKVAEGILWPSKTWFCWYRDHKRTSIKNSEKKTVFINAVRSRYPDLFSRAREEAEHLCHFRLIVSGLKKFVMLSWRRPKNINLEGC